MPIYEYECRECRHVFERYQRFSDAPVTQCPECEGSVRKVMQPVGILFKGSGWYKTDSRPAESSTNGTSSSKDTAASSAGEGAAPASGKSSDAKPSSDGATKSTASPSSKAAAASGASTGS